MIVSVCVSHTPSEAAPLDRGCHPPRQALSEARWDGGDVGGGVVGTVPVEAQADDNYGGHGLLLH